MVKLKQWLWIATLVLALAAPVAWADEPEGVAGWFEQIVAQIVAAVTGTPPADEGVALGEPGPGNQEIGINVPIGG